VGFITASIDPAKVSEARAMIPALRHDRDFEPPVVGALRAAGE
jgi:predicted amidohydrolase